VKPTCLLCDKPAHSSGLCHTHGERWRRWGKPQIEKWVDAFKAGRLNTCVQCGNGFNGYFGATTCGAACRAARHRVTSLSRYHHLPDETKAEYVARSKARYRAKVKVKKPLPPIVCRVCGEPFVPKTKVVRYCSPDCRRIGVATATANHRTQRVTIEL
jgi:hypothetical protein